MPPKMPPADGAVRRRRATPTKAAADDGGASLPAAGARGRRTPSTAAAAATAAAELATFAELAADPDYAFLADNPAIITGYRHRLSPWEAVQSVFRYHNETVNIWTHGVGAAVFIFLLGLFLFEARAHGAAGALPHAVSDVRTAEAALEGRLHGALSGVVRLPPDTPVPMWPLGVFMASAALCLGFSAAFHTFHVMSEDWFVLLSSLDYSGIAVLIWGSTLPMLTLGFYCRPAWEAVYVTVGTAIALGTVVVGVTPSFRTSEYRKVRMASFIATGCYGALPYAHLAALGEPVYPQALPRLLAMGGLYIAGALLYGYRVPERYFPGTFDRALQSHNIFHVCVFAAAVVHYRALWAHYEWRAGHAVCPAA
jgi:adiponectin receptor